MQKSSIFLILIKIFYFLKNNIWTLSANIKSKNQKYYFNLLKYFDIIDPKYEKKSFKSPENDQKSWKIIKNWKKNLSNMGKKYKKLIQNNG